MSKFMLCILLLLFVGLLVSPYISHAFNWLFGHPLSVLKTTFHAGAWILNNAISIKIG